MLHLKRHCHVQGISFSGMKRYKREWVTRAFTEVPESKQDQAMCSKVGFPPRKPRRPFHKTGKVKLKLKWRLHYFRDARNMGHPAAKAKITEWN